MATFNQVVLVGNIARDIELRHTTGGTAVCEFGLAVNERVKRHEQWVDEVSFFDITCWGRTAEVANEYLSKGSSVLISGRLKQETWESDGQKRYKVKVICERLQMLGGKKESSQHQSRHEPPATTGRTYVPDDDAPF